MNCPGCCSLTTTAWSPKASRRFFPTSSVVGIVADGRAMIDAAERLCPDVIIADVAMPNLNGFEALARLRKSHPNIKVVFLTIIKRGVCAPRAGRRRFGFRGQAFSCRGTRTGHPGSMKGRHTSLLTLTKQVLEVAEERRTSRDDGARCHATPRDICNCSRRAARRRRLQTIWRFPREPSNSTGTDDGDERPSSSAELIHFAIAWDRCD